MSKEKRTRTSSGMGSIRQRPDGRWEARYTAPDGKQKSVYGKTEKEVTAKLRGKLHEIDTGVWQMPDKMTVADWIDIWLSDYQAHTSERTVAKYRCICNKHFKKTIGSIRIQKLLPHHIRMTITAMRNGNLTAPTIRNYMTILHTMLDCAKESKIIASNPTENVTVPKQPSKQFCIIDRADIPSFVQAARQTKYPNELLLMLYTGLRHGEIRGLKWEDVDLDAGTIEVKRQLHPKNGDQQRFDTPKYDESRLIYIVPEAIDILRDQRRRQAEQHIANADTWQDTEYSTNLVFRMADGREHNDRTLYRTVKKVGAAIGMPDLSPHDLRHSYAIAALRAGIDVKTVQHNLGHKTSKMTLDVYAAYTNDAGKVGAQKLSAYIKNTT